MTSGHVGSHWWWSPLGRVFIESTSFWGWHLWVSRRGSVMCLEVYLACKRSTREEHVWSTQICPVFLREFTERAERKLRGDVLKLDLFDPILLYRLQWYLPWKWGSSMAMFVYRRVRQMSFLAGNKNLWNQVLRQARIPLHLEGEVYLQKK